MHTNQRVPWFLSVSFPRGFPKPPPSWGRLGGKLTANESLPQGYLLDTCRLGPSHQPLNHHLQRLLSADGSEQAAWVGDTIRCWICHLEEMCALSAPRRWAHSCTSVLPGLVTQLLWKPQAKLGPGGVKPRPDFGKWGGHPPSATRVIYPLPFQRPSPEA